MGKALTYGGSEEGINDLQDKDCTRCSRSRTTLSIAHVGSINYGWDLPLQHIGGLPKIVTGGWRIIRTLGWRIYKLDPATGMAAQLTGAAVIQFATQFGLPVSTTHVITGSVMGAGASRRLSALRWGVGANIVTAWVLTIPAAGLTAWVAYAILSTAGLRG